MEGAGSAYLTKQNLIDFPLAGKTYSSFKSLSWKGMYHDMPAGMLTSSTCKSFS